MCYFYIEIQYFNDNGIMILSVPNSEYEIIENGKNKDSFHLHVFKYDEIVNMLKEVGFNINKVYGQSYINKIVNGDIKEYKLSNVIDDAKNIAYPNEEDINKTYSYIFILNKRWCYGFIISNRFTKWVY